MFGVVRAWDVVNCIEFSHLMGWLSRSILKMLGEYDDESDVRIQLWQNKDVANFEAERQVKVLKMEMFLVDYNLFPCKT